MVGEPPGMLPVKAHRSVACSIPMMLSQLLIDQLGGIWEIATAANSAHPHPAGLKRSV